MLERMPRRCLIGLHNARKLALTVLSKPARIAIKTGVDHHLHPSDAVSTQTTCINMAKSNGGVAEFMRQHGPFAGVFALLDGDSPPSGFKFSIERRVNVARGTYHHLGNAIVLVEIGIMLLRQFSCGLIPVGIVNTGGVGER